MYIFDIEQRIHLGFPHSSVGKESACTAGDPGLIPGLRRSPGEGKGYPLQCSGLENSMDDIVHGITKSWTRLSHVHFQFSFWSIFFFSHKMHRGQPCFLEAKNKRQNSFIDLTSDSALDFKQEDLLILSFSHLKYWNNNVFPLLVCGLMKQYKNFEHFWRKLLYYHSNFPSKDRKINSPVSTESF